MRIRSSTKIFILMFVLLFAPRVICAESVLFEANLEETMDAVLLPVTIEGKSYSFLFDTGSTFTVFDKSLEHLLGKPLQIRLKTETPANGMSLSFFKSIDVMLGKLNLKTRSPFMTADLKFMSKVLGRGFQGIIGMSFIHKYIWELDFDQKIIRVLSSDSKITSSDYDTSINIHATSRGAPVIMIELIENSIPFLIDTGGTGSGQLTKDVIGLLIEQRLVSDVASDAMVSISGVHFTRRVRINHFKVGSLEYRNLLMGESQQNAIGLRFLKRHRSVLDFPNKRLYLRKGLYSILDREDKSGIKIINDNGKIIIELFDKRGPAVVAGLKKGDIIKSINGMPVNGNDLLRVRDILKGENGKEIIIKINRDGKSIEVRFIIKKGYDHL
jgi:predicted aspartyl protease